MNCQLTPLLGYSTEQLKLHLSTLTETQLKLLNTDLEYWLLCYPQGTGDDELEELMDKLSELLWPDS
jgi:hypothetical protein